MKPVHVNLPEGQVKALDSLVEKGMYPNRNEAIRSAVRDLVNSEVLGKLEVSR
jgi:Arc/MetJ-type ribon-helix-helix transcriptional regulator